MQRFSLLCTVLFSLLASSITKAAPFNPGNDFNGDGYSDMVLVNVSSGGVLSWRIVSGASGEVMNELSPLGELGNHLAITRWQRADRASAAFLSLEGDVVRWNLLREGGKLYSRNLGRNGQTILSGGDYDGNGLADAAVVRASGGQLRWTIKKDFLSGLGSQRLPRGRNGVRAAASSVITTFGAVGDTPFFFDPDGRGDWIAILVKDKTRIGFKNVHTGRIKSIRIKGIDTGNLRPLPLKQKRGRDRLLFARRGSASTAVTVISRSGKVLARTSLPGTGELLVGRYTNSETAQIAMQEEGSFVVLDAVAASSQSRAWGSGIAADDININSFSSAQPGPTPTPHSGEIPPEDNDPPPSGSLASICTTMHPMNRDVLYKPGSQGTSDGRTGKPAFLWYEQVNNPHIWKLYVLARNGAQIGVFGHYNFGAPLVRFYSGFAGGSGLTANELRSRALSTARSSYIYMYTKNGNCWGPIKDPRGRWGGR